MAETHNTQSVKKEGSYVGLLGGPDMEDGVVGDVAGFHAAAKQHGIRVACICQRGLCVQGDTVHGGDPRCRAGQGNAPIRFFDAIQNAEGDQRVEFIEPVKSEYGYMHRTTLTRNHHRRWCHFQAALPVRFRCIAAELLQF